MGYPGRWQEASRAWAAGRDPTDARGVKEWLSLFSPAKSNLSEGVEVSTPAAPAAKSLEYSGYPQPRVVECIQTVAYHLALVGYLRLLHANILFCYLYYQRLYIQVMPSQYLTNQWAAFWNIVLNLLTQVTQTADINF